MYDLDHCPICREELNATQKAFAHRNLQPVLCWTTCRMIDVKRRFACCNKAERLACVCMYAFRCPEPGDRHIGPHDCPEET